MILDSMLSIKTLQETRLKSRCIKGHSRKTNLFGIYTKGCEESLKGYKHRETTARFFCKGGPEGEPPAVSKSLSPFPASSKARLPSIIIISPMACP